MNKKLIRQYESETKITLMVQQTVTKAVISGKIFASKSWKYSPAYTEWLEDKIVSLECLIKARAK